MLPEKEIHIVDSMGASMCESLLAELAVGMARLGVGAAEIARVCAATAVTVSVNNMVAEVNEAFRRLKASAEKERSPEHRLKHK